MEVAMRLPITVAGALMPDAHQGYGLPIGGVLAIENAVIPYGVGVDIGCRMCLSVYNLPDKILKEDKHRLEKILVQNTLFGAGKDFSKSSDHPAVERKEFNELPVLKSLHSKAAKQLGSSGSGNHFVEFGFVEISDEESDWNLPAGKYLGVLSHSGSRGLGASIAAHYTRVAMEKCRLPGEAKHLAWLSLDSEEGQEYWKAMNVAGDYASACHHIIHEKISNALAEKPVTMVENHHNFAWKEIYEGREVIVHRKGATPAGKNVPGIIPGSMVAPGFIVKGKGEAASLNSAAHGAGRVMSRTRAKQMIDHKMLNETLAAYDVKLIGGGLDEAPQAYKSIHEVMNSQKQLVEVIGLFHPKIVRMDG
jgi:tRNA-splicing ligase RtcB